MTLHEAIEQLVNLGDRDPLRIVEKLQAWHGDEWLAEQITEHRHEIACLWAREAVNRDRLAKQRAHDGSELMAGKWVPGVRDPENPQAWVEEQGWVDIGDMTVADHERVADHYRRLETGNRAKAELHEGYAAELRATGAATLNELHGHGENEKAA